MSDQTLDQLYPWQQDQSAPAADLAGSVAAKLAASQEAGRAFFEAQTPALIAAARTLAESFRQGGRLLTMGNGGSACDAAHIAVEFTHPVTAGRPALPSLNLSADTAMLTAVANDVGVEQVFARQIIAHGRAGDVLMGVSTSGNSPNLLAGFRQAAQQGLHGIALSGGDGGELARLPGLSHCLSVPGDSVHRIQENQVLIYHILWDLVHSLLAAPA